MSIEEVKSDPLFCYRSHLISADLSVERSGALSIIQARSLVRGIFRAFSASCIPGVCCLDEQRGCDRLVWVAANFSKLQLSFVWESFKGALCRALRYLRTLSRGKGNRTALSIFAVESVSF